MSSTSASLDEFLQSLPKKITLTEICSKIRNSSSRIAYVIDSSYVMRVIRSEIRSENKDVFMEDLCKAPESFFILSDIVIEEILQSKNFRRKIAKRLGVSVERAESRIFEFLRTLIHNTAQHHGKFYVLRLTDNQKKELDSLGEKLSKVFSIKPAFISYKDSTVAAISLMLKMCVPQALIIILTKDVDDFYGITQLDIRVFPSVLEERHLSALIRQKIIT